MANRPINSEANDTYVVTNPHSSVYGSPQGYITDALTGIVTACYASGHRIPLDVPLCGQCDAIVVDAGCDCILPLSPIATVAIEPISPEANAPADPRWLEAA